MRHFPQSAGVVAPLRRLSLSIGTENGWWGRGIALEEVSLLIPGRNWRRVIAGCHGRHGEEFQIRKWRFDGRVELVTPVSTGRSWPVRRMRTWTFCHPRALRSPHGVGSKWAFASSERALGSVPPGTLGSPWTLGLSRRFQIILPPRTTGHASVRPCASILLILGSNLLQARHARYARFLTMALAVEEARRSREVNHARGCRSVGGIRSRKGSGAAS
jgi:hypothetical protein